MSLRAKSLTEVKMPRAMTSRSILANQFSTCEAKLVGNSYDCTYVNNSGPGTECLEFVTGGTSIYFDAIYNGTADFGCGCDSKGSLKSPSFDASSNTYECSLTGEPFFWSSER